MLSCLHADGLPRGRAAVFALAGWRFPTKCHTRLACMRGLLALGPLIALVDGASSARARRHGVMSTCWSKVPEKTAKRITLYEIRVQTACYISSHSVNDRHIIEDQARRIGKKSC